eukprot:COSAG01_NODE_6466_length_3651_cov_2.861486_3_plen_81_part_00
MVLQPCKQRWIARAATADHHLGQPRGGGGGGATTVRRHPTGRERCEGIRCAVAIVRGVVVSTASALFCQLSGAMLLSHRW